MKPQINSTSKILLLALVALILLEGTHSGINLLSSLGNSYVTGYEGVKASFAGVQDGGSNYNGVGDTSFLWDKDSRGSGLPAVSGEMTSVFVPSESVGKQTKIFGSGADISDWLLDSTGIKNPVDSYEWQFKTADNSTLFYRMENWELKWFFSLSAEVLGSEVASTDPFTQPTARNHYTDTKLWFKLDLAPVWYFEGAETAYFAVAEVRVSDISLGGKLKDGKYSETDKNSELRVTPSSSGSILPIYYGLFGAEANRAEKTVSTYQGKTLNPDLFTDTVYTYFTLNNFGVSSWFEFPNNDAYRGDVVTVGLTVNVFVVGEWKVKDIQEIPDEYGRTAQTGGFGWNTAIAQWLNDPATRLLLALAGIVGVFLVLALFAPWVLIALMSIFGGRKR